MAVSLLWLAAIFAYWRRFVPLVPTAVIPLPTPPPGLQYEFRAAPNGEVVSMLEWIGSGSRGSPYFGPIQFWNPRTGKLVRQLFDEQTGILEMSRHCTFAAVRDRDSIQMVDLRNGEAVFLQKTPGETVHVRFSRDERIASFTNAQKTVVFCDATTGKELWSRRADEWAPLEPTWLTGELFLCFKRSTPPDNGGQSSGTAPPPDRILLDAFTGQPDQRFGFHDRLRLSSDGRRTIAWDDVGPARICNYRTGERRWTLPAGVSALAVDFTPDSRELVLPANADGRTIMAR